HDLREQRFVLHTLQLAVQATLDTASHVVSDERLGEPDSYRDLFDLLATGGWIANDQVPPLRRMRASATSSSTSTGEWTST
ncbi:MAG TPA: HepT-like ribonuclease domain-containing protein, partial [Thermoanaerobaculia bacterium]|nr:HepT-like ribonuclease domain-containing protein [Thermoanaerobaculia bacterium]